MHSVVVGAILGPHGVRGEMRIFSLTDVPERFSSMRCLHLYRKNGAFVRSLPLASVRMLPGKPHFLASSPEITTPEEVKTLQGLEVRVSKEERPPLEEGEFWVEDLLGLEVIHGDTRESCGVITQILPTGASDVYVLRTPEGEERMLPAVQSVILEVDLERRIMLVHPPEGLWD